MKVYKHEFRVSATLAEVAQFHSDTQSLKLLTPPPLVIQFNGVEPLAEGSVAEFTIWMGPIPVRWKAVHRDVDPIAGFKDVQLEGPFRHWEHTHSFLETGPDLTVIMDEIQAEFNQQPYKKLVCRMMWSNLPNLFAYRRWKTKQLLET
jgi:ligand-binding SRPBCC domain-containing protein